MKNGYGEAHLPAVNLPINFLKADRLESMIKFADELGVTLLCDFPFILCSVCCQNITDKG